ncbi:MAG: VOC family protein [Gammaproteobacteria bacterium]
MNSLFPDICSDALPESRDFYVSLLGFKPVFEMDWYIQLQAPNDENVQLAFVARDHPSVPEGYRVTPQGVVITVELNDIEPVHRRALQMGVTLIQELRDEVWGQRHFMAADPNGLLVDVVQMIAPAPEFAEQYTQAQPV